MPDRRIEWTPEVAAGIDARSLRVYRAEAVKAKSDAEAVLAKLTPPEKFAGFIGLFQADVETADRTVVIIEAELDSRGLPYE